LATITARVRDKLEELAATQQTSASVDALALFSNAWGIPDAWQAGVLTSSWHRLFLNCSRQAGKSTVTSVIAVHTAITVAKSLTLLLSPTLRQSIELFSKCMSVYNATPGLPTLKYESKTGCELADGSRIVALPGKPETVRGFSAVTLLVIDEAAFTGDPLYRAVRPMLAVSNGRLALLSTPFGKRGFYHGEYENIMQRAFEGKAATWNYVEVPATDIPRIPASHLEEERISLGPVYAQEYENQFLNSDVALFDYDTVQRALDSGEEYERWF
jgi:hypothetical protein